MAATLARADVLNFNDITTFPNPEGTLPDGYGSTPLVSISYASSTGAPNTPGYPTYPPYNYVFWWPQYGDLTSVIYSANPFGSILISFTPASGYELTLNSFDLGQDVNADDGILAADVLPLQILDTAGPGFVFPYERTIADIHTHIDSGYSSTGTVTLVVGNNWNIGIDNIDYSVKSVPEPSTFILLATAGFGILLRRRFTC